MGDNIKLVNNEIGWVCTELTNFAQCRDEPMKKPTRYK
jgi:hypothetical protein